MVKSLGTLIFVSTMALAGPSWANTTAGSLCPSPGAPLWLDFETGLETARTAGVPILLWLAPFDCDACGAAIFDHVDVSGMLADFVTVRAPLRMADQFGLDGTQSVILLLDPLGNPVQDLTITAEDAEGLIDLMSSGLDILR